MVSIFVGSGAGFARGSGATLGGAGILGSGVQGRSGETVSVNAATGNLLISQQDEFLVGRGPDSAVSRTYNSLAQVNDDNGDQWRFGSQRRLANWTGTANTAGATVDRVGEDGSVVTYTYDAGLGYYRTTDGAGAHDKIVNVGHWIWTDGDTQTVEGYDIDGNLLGITDTDGNSITFTYHAHTYGWRLSRATTSNGEYQEYQWSGENVAQIVTGYTELATNISKTLTRTRYAYDGQNRLTQVTVDLSPEDNSVADGRTYVTTYTYDGSSKRVASIAQTDGSSLAIAYDASGRVTTLTQAVAAGDVRVTRIGYGVNVTSVTGPDDQVTRLWYDNKKQLVQLMSPPATKGGVSQVLQYEYDPSGNLIRTIETDSVNASIPANLVNAAGWGDGEVAGRGENLVDDSGWPQDVDGTLPANGTIGPGWDGTYIGETEWTVTTGPYGTSVVSMKAGQNDAAGAGGGGVLSGSFAIDAKKAYEFTYYFKLSSPAQHNIYFGTATGDPAFVEFAQNGTTEANPYFFSASAAWQNANLTVGKWYKVVGYVLPEGSANVGSYDHGGIYDTTTGERITVVNCFRWSEDRVSNTASTRFFNFYGTDVSKNTHFWKPEVREVSDFAILRTGGKLDIVKDRNLIERSLPAGWNWDASVDGDKEARWSEMLGPDGSWQVGLETGQFDGTANGGGNYTNSFTVDPTKTYRFTQYVRKSDLSRHFLYFGVIASSPATVKNAWDGAENLNPYFLSWTDDSQRGLLQEDRWYKIVGYVLPQGSANVGYSTLGGIYDAVTGARIWDVNNFRWNETMPSTSVVARYFNYYDETEHGWSADWLAPEVVEIENGELAADNANPFGVTYDESGRISRFTYDANGNLLSSTDANGNTVTRIYGAKNELLTETRTGTHAGASITDRHHPDLAQWSSGGATFASGGAIDGVPATLLTSMPGATWSGISGGWTDVVAGDQITFEITLQAVGSITSQLLGLWGTITGQGANGTATAKILSGPGSLADAGGAYWRINDLSTTQATRIQITRTYTQAEAAGAYLYIDEPGGFRDGAQLLAADPKVSLLRGGNTELTTRYVYDGENHLRYVVTPEGRVTEYTYHGSGETYTVTEYPEHGYPVGSGALSEAAMNAWRDSIADKQSLKHSYMVYDARGNMTQKVDYGYMTSGGAGWTSEGYTHSFWTYDQNGRVLSRQTAPQNSETFVYDGLGRLIGSTDMAGGTTTIVFNDAALTTTVTTASGATTVNSYNRAGDLVGTTQSGSYDLNRSASHLYDKNGRLRRTIDATGVRTYHLYDKVGRTVADVNSYGDLIEYRYDPAGRVAATIRYGNVLTAGQLAMLDDPNSTAEMSDIRPAAAADYDIWSWSIYDDAGRLIQSIAGDGSVSAFSYDASDRLVKTIRFYNKLSAGQLAAFKGMAPVAPVLPAVDTRDTVSRSFYDRDGLLIGTLDGEGFLSEIVYDDAGQKVEEIAYATRGDGAYLAEGTLDQLRATVSPGAAANRRSRYVYDGQGFLRFAVDNAGYVTEYIYESDVEWGAIGPVRSTVRHAVAIATSDFTYDNVKALVGANAGHASNRASWSVYNSAGRLAYTIDPDGAVTGFTYDVAGNVIKTVAFATRRPTDSVPHFSTMDSWSWANHGDPANRITRNWYTAAGDLRFSVDGEGYARRFDYDAEGRLTREVTWADKVAATDATTIEQIDSIVYTSANWTDVQYTYDLAGRQNSVYDGEGNRTVYLWYGNGERCRVIHAYGTPDQSDTVYGFDGAGRIVSEYSAYGEPEQAVTSYSFDGLGNRTSVTDPRGKVTSYTYDERGFVLTKTDAAGGITSYEYNAFGEVVKTTDPRGNATYSYYDSLGRVTSVRDAEDYVTETSYTRFGEIASVTRRHNKTASAPSTTTPPTVVESEKDATTFFEYDKRGLVTKTTDAEGFFETYVYDAFGNRERMIGKSAGTAAIAGGTTYYAYDRRGLLVAETLPAPSADKDGNVLAYYTTNNFSYDARGNRIQMIEAAGLPEARTTTYVYDKANRRTETRMDVIRVVPSSGLNAVETRIDRLTYDSLGNVTSRTDPAGARTVYYYDDLGRVVATIDAVGTYSANIYDANGNIISTTIYGTAVAIPADGGSEEERPAAPGGDARTTSFTYDNLNRLLTRSVAGVASYIFDGTSYVLQASSLHKAYEYDATGNVVKTIDANGGVVWNYYDKLGRKIQQLDAGGYVTTWAYDAEGNVLIENRWATRFTGSPHAVSVPANAADRSTVYVYDRNGNRLIEQRRDVLIHDGAGGTSNVHATVYFQYNGLGQVVRKWEATGEDIQYQYDSAGRVGREIRSAFQDHQGNWDNPTIDYFYDALGNLTRTVAAGAGDAAARITRFQYGTGGVLEWMQDSSGKYINYYFDLVGREAGTLVDNLRSDGTSLESRTLSWRDALGRVTESRSYYYVNAAGAGWDWGDGYQTSYNAYGEVVTTTVNGGVTAENRYDGGGRLVATTAGDGVWKHFGYDGEGNQTIAITSAGANLGGLSFEAALALVGQEDVNATYTMYDARGQAVSVTEEQRRLSATDVQTLTSTRSYNAFGEVVSETDANGATTSYSYNNIGRMIRSEGPTVQITLENGTALWVKPSQDYYYDASGRLVATRDANGSYAAGGTSANGTSKTANSGNLTRLTLLAGTGYNGSEALVTQQIAADGGVKTTRYDVHGDARTSIDEIGRTTTQLFDQLGRVTQVNHAGGLVDHYGYDSLGQRIWHWNNVLGSGDKETTDYDTQGRVIRTRAFGGDVTTTSYTWDASLAAAGMGITTGGWTKTISTVADRTSTSDNIFAIVEKSDIFGRVVDRIDAGGQDFAYGFDLAGRLTTENSQNVFGNVLRRRTYSYFNTGQVASIGTGDPTSTTTDWQRRTTSYSYDAVGNQLTETLTRQWGDYTAGHWIWLAPASPNGLSRPMLPAAACSPAVSLPMMRWGGLQPIVTFPRRASTMST